MKNIKHLNSTELKSINGGSNPSCAYDPPGGFIGSLDYMIGWVWGTLSVGI